VVGSILTAIHAVTYGRARWQLVFDFSFIAFGLMIAAAGLARSLARGEQNEV
jgi:hypothetical protein